MIAATYARRSICDCGTAVLKESVPLGTTYQVEPDSIAHGGIICSCGKATPCDLILTDDGGWLPIGILDLEGASA
jgi:hypothetical protein